MSQNTYHWSIHLMHLCIIPARALQSAVYPYDAIGKNRLTLLQHHFHSNVFSSVKLEHSDGFLSLVSSILFDTIPNLFWLWGSSHQCWAANTVRQIVNLGLNDSDVIWEKKLDEISRQLLKEIKFYRSLKLIADWKINFQVSNFFI